MFAGGPAGAKPPAAALPLTEKSTLARRHTGGAGQRPKRRNDTCPLAETGVGVMMRIGITVLATSLLAACSATEPGDLAGGPGDPQGRVRVVGAIKGYNQDDPRIEVSTQGRIVRLAVTTYGGGCHAQGETQVVVSGLTADVTPYDYTAPSATICTAQLVSFRHDVVISFDRGGTAVIRVHGIDAGTRTAQNPEGTKIVVERRVELQ
jgi:hypothetical protein